MSSKHVCLQRGESEVELQVEERPEEKEKIAPFAFEKAPKPLTPTLGLVPDASTVEINNKNSSVAPFHYKD